MGGGGGGGVEGILVTSSSLATPHPHRSLKALFLKERLLLYRLASPTMLTTYVKYAWIP